MKPIAPNTMIQNRYLVVQPIGKGGMGEVYLAVDQRLGSATALKRTYFQDDGALGGAFEREARILARLRHPVLPKVIDHFSEGGDQFLVMEHISGEDIAKRLETTQKPFPLNWVMFWADQLLDALTYLHNHEPPIIHRDIKPQNLKLTDENHIVLLDFGLSKDFETGGNSLNSASVAGYSPHFAAMEQIRGTGTDARSDLYSLSATLYQLLTNEIPVDALTRADALLGGKPDPVKPLNEIVDTIPSSVSDVLLKGIALRQEQRFSSAAEMQKALRRAYNHGSPSATDTQSASAAITRLAAGSADIAASPSLDATLQMNPADLPTPVIDSEVETSVKKKSNRVQINEPPVSETQAASIRPSREAVVNASATKPAKGGRLAGIAAGSLVLLAIIAAGGWFAYNNYLSGTAPALSNSNSAGPSTVLSENPSSGTNLSPPANSSIANSDANVVPEATNKIVSNGHRSTNSSIKPATGKAQVPTSKATPKPKSGDDRTVIIQ